MSKIIGDYLVLDQIGKGGYSEVFRVKKRSEGKFYALKVIKLNHFQNIRFTQQILREVLWLVSSKEREGEFLDIFCHQKNHKVSFKYLYIVMRLYRSDLSAFLHRNRLSEDLVDGFFF